MSVRSARGESSVARMRRELRAAAEPERVATLQRFFRTGPGQYGEGDLFLGVRVPEVRRVARAHRGLEVDRVVELLHSPWHEERLLALLIMVEQYRRADDSGRERLFILYLENTRFVNSWDLVDVSAEHIVGAHLDPARLDTLERLARSDLLWERRIAMIATFHWIRQGVPEPTLYVARLLLHDAHDLIHKAVGWMLREVGKRDRDRAEAFLLEHYRVMPRTMLRYAVERFPATRRQQFLRGDA